MTYLQPSNGARSNPAPPLPSIPHARWLALKGPTSLVRREVFEQSIKGVTEGSVVTLKAFFPS